MRAPRNMTGPRRASDGSNTGGKSKAVPAKPTSKPMNKMPTRSVGKPVGKRVGRSTPTTRSKAQKPTAAPARPTRAPARPAQTRRPTTLSANPYQRAYQRDVGKRQEGIKPSNYKAQTRRPTTSSRSSPAQKPAERRSAHLSRMARGRRR